MGNQMGKPSEPNLDDSFDELHKKEIKSKRSSGVKNNKYKQTNLIKSDVLNDLDSIFMIP